MEASRPTVKTTNGDGAFKLKHLCNLLDTLVAVRWDLNNGLHDGVEIPARVSDGMRRIDGELEDTIGILRTLIHDRGLPL